MKRQKPRRARPARSTGGNDGAAQPVATAVTRRGLLARGRTLALAAVAVGGGGWFAVREVQATLREHDLARIGNGTPAVVQIHDPQCSLCVALQSEARDAVCEFGETELQFLVANIRTAEGRQLARQHGVAHVTLLLFDADGKRRRIMTGPQNSAELKQAFRRHLTHYGRR